MIETIELCTKTNILFDLGNGAKTLSYLRQTYSEKGLRIVDRLVELGLVSHSISMDYDMIRKTYYRLVN